MKKDRTILALLLSVLLVLTACGGGETPPVQGIGPGRLVRRIEVTVQPKDSNYARTYVTQENMNDLLALLRAMETTQYPETEPDIHSGQTCYSATVTYSNGEQTVYYLLGHTYLRLGEEDWCVIDNELSRQFIEFLRSHPTDDGSVEIETTAAPTETTAPTQTTQPAE